MKSASSAPFKPLPAFWSTAGYGEPIHICFGADVPPKFSALLRVEHAWREPGKRLKRETTRTARFTFQPNRGFVTPTYSSRARHETKIFENHCLEVFPTMQGTGTRVGTFTFTYIYKGKYVSSARYKYDLERTRTHLAKEGEDDFLDYCLRDRPDTISRSAGVRMCSVPGKTLIVYARP